MLEHWMIYLAATFSGRSREGRWVTVAAAAVLRTLRGVNNNYRSCSKNKPADRHNNLISKRLILEHSNSNNSSQLFAARADNCELDRRETAEESSGLCVCVTRLVTIVVTHGAGEIDGVVIKETYRGVEREEPSTFWEKVRGRVANETATWSKLRSWRQILN